MKRRAFIASFKNKNKKYAEVGTDAILGNMTINDKEGFVEVVMNDREKGFETIRIDPSEYDGVQLIKEEVEYNMKVTDDKIQTNASLYDKDKDEIISSLRGAIEISVLGNENLKNQVMKICGIAGYTSESELMTGN